VRRSAVLCLYLLAMVGVFCWLFSMDASDDYAGWVPGGPGDPPGERGPGSRAET
jgi:hypothetical protein